ncbi:AprI/Inh family metalloprotease inhibitor [Breoghania sp.]|uniref:protease inhibitor Inh/omp19 family protein n=1 Tax=Breoghania sp. TaxID=2065378 RepID=UPI0029C9ED11|nr:AprI/Inh family metalloprotease inhibitor [Breoghania sp.]
MKKAASIAAMLCLGALAAGCTRFDYGRSQSPAVSAPRQPVSQGGGLQPLVVAPDQGQPGYGQPGYGQPGYGNGGYGNGNYPAGTAVGPDGQPLNQPGMGPQSGAQGTDVAAATPQGGATSNQPAPPAGAPQIGRTELLGGWTISAGGNSCKLFMNLTKWSGGYRANTQGCGGPPLGAIAAWDLNGAQVILKDSNGVQIATLYKSGNERYDGRTGAGYPISVSR